jgi:hypothetical protein
LESVLAQTYKNWECIIINDGSTDHTEGIVQLYCKKDARFRYIKKENSGLSAARNTGLGLIIGDYIQFLDSDDLILPQKFEIQLNNLLSDLEIDICISSYKSFSNGIDSAYDTRLTKAQFDCNLESFLYDWEDKISIAIHCYLIKKDFLVKNKIRFNENLKAMEDWFFLIESALNKAKFSKVEQSLALYRKHEKSMSVDPDRMSGAFLETAFSIFEILPQNIKPEFKSKISKIIINRINNNFGERENTRKANSIDYKTGFLLLYPLHRISGFIKKIFRIIS